MIDYRTLTIDEWLSGAGFGMPDPGGSAFAGRNAELTRLSCKLETKKQHDFDEYPYFGVEWTGFPRRTFPTFSIP
jgi:hypothetical protein